MRGNCCVISLCSSHSCIGSASNAGNDGTVVRKKSVRSYAAFFSRRCS